MHPVLKFIFSSQNLPARLLLFFAFLLAAFPARAGENCAPATLRNGTAVLEGMAPADDTLCFRLSVAKGQTIQVNVVQGDNTIFSIEGLVDAEDHYTLTATQPAYDIHVGQMMRAAGAQPFRIAVTANGQASARATPAPPKRLTPLTRFKDCDRCPSVIVIPPGNYLMGASAEDRKLTDKYTISAELPRHPVTIGYSFAVGEYMVTVDEFAAYVAETGAATGGDCLIRTPDFGAGRGVFIRHPTMKKGELPVLATVPNSNFRNHMAGLTGRYPATCISRQEAKGYLEWLSRKTGRKYRFPTEAEWEYALRARSTAPFHFGGGLRELCKYGNFADSKSPYEARSLARCAENPSPPTLAPVDAYQPNEWGIYGMIGNSFEFIEDCLYQNYQGAPGDGRPWQRGPNNNQCRSFVLRGYYFDSPGSNLRSAARCTAGNDWTEREAFLGLRVAVSLDEQAWDSPSH